MDEKEKTGIDPTSIIMKRLLSPMPLKPSDIALNASKNARQLLIRLLIMLLPALSIKIFSNSTA
jgi:hypothetical protein